MDNSISNTATVQHVAPVTSAISKPLQLATILFLGMVMLYGAGFVQTSAVHNAAHDVRHAVAFPCH